MVLQVYVLCVLVLSGSGLSQKTPEQASAQNPSRVQIDWQLEKTRLTTGSKPVYPSIAAMAHIEGVVRIRLIVATDGSAKDLTYLSGAPLLMRAAMDALRTWHFEPYLVEGKPVEVETIAPVGFFLNGHDPDTLLAEYRKKVEKRPDDAKAHSELAHELLAVGLVDESITEFRKAVAQQPGDASLHFGLGGALQARGEMDAGIAEYRQGLSIKPNDTEARYNFASLLESAGDLDGAIAEYRATLKDVPGDGWRHSNFGLLLMKKGDVDEAIEQFRHAIHEGFGIPDTHYQLGLALERKGDTQGALKEYKKAASESPNEEKYREARDRLEHAPHS